MNRQGRADQVRRRVRDAIRAYPSERAAAQEIPISNTALNKFLKRGEVPYDRTLDLYEAWLERIGYKEDSEQDDDTPASEPDPWLTDFERTVRYFGGRADVDPEERRRRQRDMVNGMIDARKQRGADVPAALYALLGRLERDEL